MSATPEIEAVAFASLTEELLLQVAEFLPARDLLQFQSVSIELSCLSTDALWKKLCENRWKPWPRYRLTDQRFEELDKTLPGTSWQVRYATTEQDATRSSITESELHDLQWYLSFVLSGIRGEGRSDHMPVIFTPSGILLVPGHPPLPFELRNEAPPTSAAHIRTTLRGDQPFSERQWLRISDFPPHFISRKQSDAEWLIANENVMMVSSKKG